MRGKLIIISVGLVWFVCVITSLKGWIRLIAAFLSIFIKKLRPYVMRNWISDDQDTNALFNGRPDLSISGRVGFKARTDSRYYGARDLINKLFWWQKNHCESAVEEDEVKQSLGDAH